ncbi:MAG: helix-turn-helix domain-containing protein [Acidobacteriota bacterium]
MDRIRKTRGVCRVCGELEREFETLCLKQAARACRMSRSDFCTKFRLACRMSFHQFLILIRTVRAIELLMSSCFSVTELAFRAGFPSLGALEYAFRKLLHSSPVACRACLPRSADGRKEWCRKDSSLMGATTRHAGARGTGGLRAPKVMALEVGLNRRTI